MLLESASIKEAAVAAEQCGYRVLGANRELAGAEVELVALEQRERRLKAALAEVAADYDFVLIDCPPSLSMLTLNGLCSAHGVIVPMQCEYFALEGLTDLVNTIKQVHANLNKDLQIIGLLRVMFDPRITLQAQVSAQLKDHFGDKVFDTVIPRNVRLAEAPSYGLPGVVFDPQARGSQAFVEFAREMVRRVQQVLHPRLPPALDPPGPSAIKTRAHRMNPSNVLILPGWQNSGEGHWQTRWERLHGWQRLEQHDWQRAAARRLVRQARRDRGRCRRPRRAGRPQPGLHPHRLVGRPLAQHPQGAGRAAGRARRRGVARSRTLLPGWSPIARQPLPFPATLVASRNDPYCHWDRATALAGAWGAQLHDAGERGHLNAESELGDWPEGLALLQALVPASRPAASNPAVDTRHVQDRSAR